MIVASRINVSLAKDILKIPKYILFWVYHHKITAYYHHCNFAICKLHSVQKVKLELMMHF